MSLIFGFGHWYQDVFEIKIYQIGNLMFLCIVAFVGDGLTAHMDSSNIDNFDLKLYLNRF
jgi:hypothetical protein